MPVKMLTDHKGLEYFMTTKKLTPRQARWKEFLSKFNFIVTYQTGKKNDKADALIKKPNECLVNNKDDKQEHRMQTLLSPERLKMHPIEVTDQLEKHHKLRHQKSHEPERLEVRNQPEQQGVEAEQEEKRLEDLATLPD